MSVKVNTVVVGPLEENCYIVSDPDKGCKCFLVDPGANGNRILDTLHTAHLQPEAILLTHGHFDHICAVEWILRQFPRTLIYALAQEKEVLEDPDKSLLSAVSKGVFIKDVRYLEDESVFQPAGIDVRVLATPGHTGGSCCYSLDSERILFSGDTLFHESCGRTDLPTGSDAALRKSVREKLMPLPEDTVCYPGHGESTTIEHEKKYNFVMLGF